MSDLYALALLNFIPFAYMYSYYSRITDPVLMKLESATVSALESANIYCLEDLLRVDPDSIIDLPGIGKKRNYEIQRFLHSLPFDFKRKPTPINPDQDGMLGVEPELGEYLQRLRHYTDDKTRRRGLNYFQGNRVTAINRLEASEEFEIFVKGSRQYRVTLPANGTIEGQEHCGCPAFHKWMYGAAICKHVVAAAYALAEKQRLCLFEDSGDTSPAYRQLEHTLKHSFSNGRSLGGESLEYMLVRKNGEWDLYPKKIYPLLNSLNKTTNYSYRFRDPWSTLSPENSRDQMIVNLLSQIYNDKNYYMGKSSGLTVSIGEVLELAKERPLFVKLDKKLAELTPFRSQPFELSISISSNNDPDNGKHTALNIECALQSGGNTYKDEDVEFVETDPGWILADGKIGKLEANDLALQLYYSTKGTHIDVPEDELDSFLRDLYPLIKQAGVPIEFSEDLKVQGSSPDPEPRLYLSENGQVLQVDLKIGYDGFEINDTYAGDELLTPADRSGNPDEDSPLLVSVRRNRDKEQKFVQDLEDHGLQQNGESWRFYPEGDALEWALEQLRELSESGFHIFGQKELARYAPPKKMTSSTFRVTSGEQWFEVEGSLSFGDMELSMSDIERVLVKNKTYVRLADDSLGELPENWVEQLKKLMKLTDGELEEGNAKISRIAAPLVKEIGKEADSYETDADFEEYAARLQSFEQIEEVSPPVGFKGELRSYQSAGLSWMTFLNRYSFGGILADDMGLGKTIQVLALLKNISETEGRRLNSLIVSPRSVVQNWMAEAGKFVPDFEVSVHHGTDRASEKDELPDVDLLITTYGTMRNDIDLLSEKIFDYAILDESHTVRNPSSKTFRALRKIRAKNRLCLTGTPVQNTTMDLWSQFEFLNPGLLGHQKSFRNRWVKPIEKEGDKMAEELLNKMVSPFILRRTKKQVATDLPPLTSSLVDCPMEHAQHLLYEKYRNVYREMVNESINEKGIDKARFTVLEGLLRLRQISCSPKLIDGESAPSAKLERFIELASELISEGHRALVFSQFVGFLKLVEAEVQKQGWSYEYLDGKTTDRQERVDRFQADESKKLFLISLKAGGEGLNLTGADYVFIMDPWWNPAAERQAMDRTHRIGQRENVFVYRFITPASVEEKILRLQDRKRDLADKLVVAESGIFKELDKQDLLKLFE